MTAIDKIQLGKNGPMVSKLGLGCLRMSQNFTDPVNSDDESISTISEALDCGINFLNTGDFYGSGASELLIGKAIKGRRDDAFISVKFGSIMYNKRFIELDFRPAAIKNFINYSLVRLGIDTIDLYQPCRLDGNIVPIEDVIGTVADLIQEGKVRYLGVSQVTPEQLRIAHEIYPVSALEVGYSLADRQIEDKLLPVADELGIGVVAFAVTSERLLTGNMKAPLADDDYRRNFSRFQGDNFLKNLEKVEMLKDLAQKKGYTPAQLAIAWVNAQGDHIMPLVSMGNKSRLAENIEAMHIKFDPDEMESLHQHFSQGAIIGNTFLHL
ncbi:aldo/keto reductase [Pedobacter hartonius]|uniref:Predicted oxidoreductase n=1 Tax=Pedobacter hartonius TaxID=425514 RepID=A0A1H4GFS0_9SPHI|nr:aldo/keto reductase [Pedobacter hartonius]SEB08327.1 Predicted oxidoreductase [Pedobacter hartonius]